MTDIARYDKYDPVSGGFRAPLEADLAVKNTIHAVTLNANGRVVVGGTVGDVAGVMVITRDMKAGDVVDVMTDGEIVEAGLTAGTAYYAAADGTVGTTAPAAGANGTRVGRTVEADRLVVRVQQAQG